MTTLIRTKIKRKSISKLMKSKVLERDNHQCVYCGLSSKDGPLTMDHRIPLSKGGANKIDNLLTACLPCNRKKADGIWAIPLRLNEMNSHADKNIKNPLIEKFIHILSKPRTEFLSSMTVSDQGQIIGFSNQSLVIQTYSWLDGTASEIIVIPSTRLDDGTTIIYPTEDVMKKHFEQLVSLALSEAS